MHYPSPGHAGSGNPYSTHYPEDELSMSEYKATLNLPKTSFPMRANLNKNEPKMLAYWEEINAYEQMIKAGKDKERYVLHDGPPYANGHLHMGHALNKILKDIIVKNRNMAGFKAEYVPGWDCHGLPIEHKVEQELGAAKKDKSILEVRTLCREYALKWLDIQRSEFKRFGGLGLWEKPYMTMTPDYETATARELARFMDQGSVVRNKKPIYWCSSCQTALAEAEVEYDDHTSPSIFVRFPITDQAITTVFPQCAGGATFIDIWTTTPWTIPDNMAVAVHPDFIYVLVKTGDSFHILAKDLVEENKKRFGWDDLEILGETEGRNLEHITATHPFYDRTSPIVLADYVTLETGTGCVHTAPGHGREDYETGLRYGLEVLSPLDDQGRFLASVKYFAGKTVFEANPLVIEKLQETGNLLATEKITHSYPHCWRCKKPVIFRATTQWFISMEANDLRDKALAAIDKEVNWVPAWGKERIYNMIKNRPDWCISRQRMWGVPIIALLCRDCGQAWFDSQWVHGIVDKFSTHPCGADYWFEASLDEVVPEDLVCPHCGSKHWEKEDDILDVWFDSGTSFAAVVEGREECRFPADLYLEGTDQHRGWFHSSLLASVGNRGQAPYTSVLTHGFVVDGKGHKMSKSVGNVIAPEEIIEKYGAEILRLWVAASNYQEDLRISDEILRRLVDAYRRIRNTCRYILGNLRDFDPAADMVDPKDMLPLDRYALDRLAEAHQTMQKAYEEFEFHKVYHTLHNLCATDLSAFYLDILKDRLYVSPTKGIERRSGQTAMYHILLVLLENMAPILSFTAEEVFSNMPETIRPDITTVFGFSFPEFEKGFMDEEETQLWDMLVDVRTEVTKAIEPMRQSKELGHSLDSHVTLYVKEDMREDLEKVSDYLRPFFIVSKVTLAAIEDAPENIFASQEIPDLKVAVTRAPGTKCARCWVYDENLGTNPDHPDACPRCTKVLEEIV
jgi:isoleucyl-tRNA synthetase